MVLSKYNTFVYVFAAVILIACNNNETVSDSTSEAVKSTPDELVAKVIIPNVVTERTLNDTDDPAIWINHQDPEQSIVFGTDKETNGAIYAFGLDGKIIEEKTIRGIRRPNNVDIEYGFKLNDSTEVDIMVFTEREKQQIRVFSVPDMVPLDQGGFKVFDGDTIAEHNLPMGLALYKSPLNGKMYAIVGRKSGPKENYLHQYELIPEGIGIKSTLARTFGTFSEVKEIEAIAVDDEKGFVYYSDEGVCIKKYYAEPDSANTELACFGGEFFGEDIEGIAITNNGDGTGCLIVSDQQRGQFNLFDRQDNTFIKSVALNTIETDGCEVVTNSLGEKFPNGLFVAMNDDKNFFFYDLDRVLN